MYNNNKLNWIIEGGGRGDYAMRKAAGTGILTGKNRPKQEEKLDNRHFTLEQPPRTNQFNQNMSGK